MSDDNVVTFSGVTYRVVSEAKIQRLETELYGLYDRLQAAHEENEQMRKALYSIEAYVDRRVIAHRDIAEMAESRAAGKKQRVRLSEASDILGKIRAARAAMGESDA